MRKVISQRGRDYAVWKIANHDRLCNKYMDEKAYNCLSFGVFCALEFNKEKE